jgi:cytochrome P450
MPGPSEGETLERLPPPLLAHLEPFLADMVRRYGHSVTFKVRERTYTFVNDAALVKDVLVTQQQAFSKVAARPLEFLVGLGLLTSEDPMHRHMRRIVQPAFHRDRLAAYARVMNEHARAFVDRLQPNEPIDMHAAMRELTLRVVVSALFGEDGERPAQRMSEAVRSATEEFFDMLGEWQGAGTQPTIGPRFERARKQLDDIVYGLIERRRQDGPSNDILSMLLCASDGTYRPSDEQIRDEMVTLFVAGHETTADLMTWTFFSLASEPKVDERLLEALRQGDAGFADRVVHESLRLFPPVWLIRRESLRNVWLVDGSFVPAKSTLLICPKLLHVRPEYFADPLRFEPDRWVGPEPPPFAYVPFGGGARRCIGEGFALDEASILLKAIAQRFSFARETDSEIKTVTPAVTLCPAGPVWLRTRPRGGW